MEDVAPRDQALAAEPGAHAAAVLDVQERCGQALFGLACRLGLSEELAADAVQETLTRPWSALRRGEAVEHPDAWAFRVLYRLAMDEHRLHRRAIGVIERLGRARRDRPSDPQVTADELAVWSAVDRLPVRQRVVLYLRYRGDLPYEQIGSVLGISAGAARTHAATGLAALRRQLTEDEG